MEILDLMQSGIYGFKDINLDKIVYVGSTRMSFIERFAHHLRDIRLNKHCNPKLTALIKSKQFELVILESGKFTEYETLEKERYYSELYNVLETGYNITIGGSRVITNPNKTLSTTHYRKTMAYKSVVNKIENEFLNRRIFLKERNEIIEYCKSKGYEDVCTRRFVHCMEMFGFAVQRLADKKSYIISKRNYIQNEMEVN